MTPVDASLVADLTTQLGYPTSAEETAERVATLARPDEHAMLVAEVEAAPSPGCTSRS